MFAVDPMARAHACAKHCGTGISRQHGRRFVRRAERRGLEWLGNSVRRPNAHVLSNAILSWLWSSLLKYEISPHFPSHHDAMQRTLQTRLQSPTEEQRHQVLTVQYSSDRRTQFVDQSNDGPAVAPSSDWTALERKGGGWACWHVARRQTYLVSAVAQPSSSTASDRILPMPQCGHQQSTSRGALCTPSINVFGRHRRWAALRSLECCNIPHIFVGLAPRLFTRSTARIWLPQYTLPGFPI